VTFPAAGLSDVGQRREKNEDSYLLDAAGGILIVADGLGGRPAGEVASRLACETALAVLSDATSPEDLGERMSRAVVSANAAVWEKSQAETENAGMGTTVTSLLVDAAKGRLGIGHVGDSRAYRFREGTLERLTTDHTLVQELLEAGAISETEAEGHPLGYLLNRAVGTEPEVKVEVIVQEIRPEDVFLLCTDGLLAVLNEQQIAEVLADQLLNGDGRPRVDSAVFGSVFEDLVRQANVGGAPDNVTIGMLGVPAI